MISDHQYLSDIIWSATGQVVHIPAHRVPWEGAVGIVLNTYFSIGLVQVGPHPFATYKELQFLGVCEVEEGVLDDTLRQRDTRSIQRVW